MAVRLKLKAALLCVYLCSRYKMSGTLPLLSLRISDDKLRSVLGLIDSIPLPKSTDPAPGNHQAPVLKVRKYCFFKLVEGFATVIIFMCAEK